MALVPIARLTFANNLRQPVTWMMTVVALLLIGLSCLFGMFNFHSADRLRLITTAGVAIHTIHGLFLAIMLSSSAIHDELASRTSLTLFAKPVSRGEFLLGKVLGVFVCIMVTSVILIGVHVLALYLSHDPSKISYKPEDSNLIYWGRLTVAHGLCLFQILLFCCISAVLALRLPLVINIVASFGVFILGHMLGSWQWNGALLIPALSLFNLDSALQFHDLPLTMGYIIGTCGYALTFCTACLCLGLALIKGQDIP